MPRPALPDSGPLSFREAGAGPVLVFVHGIGVSSRYFVPLMKELSGGFRCLAPDLPGSGGSRGPQHALDVPGLADALANFLDAMGLGPGHVTLVGNSLGCQVAVALAEREPERSISLVLIAPTIDPATRHHFWRSLLRAGVREPLSLLPILLCDYLRFGLRRFIATSRHALADDFPARLPHLHVPALVIRGARDRIVGLPWVTRVAQLLPFGHLALIPDGAHAVHYSRPAAVARLIRTFLATCGHPQPRPLRSPHMEAHMELERKTTILLSPALHDRLTSLARRRGVSMGALIRDAVEAQYGLVSADDRMDAVAGLAALGLPVGSPAEMKAESVESPADAP